MKRNKLKQYVKMVFQAAPGAGIFVSKSDEILLEETSGFTSQETNAPITALTAFRLASLTKQFTAMAIMLLYEKKLIGLNDKLAKFLPDFPTYAGNITIRQLLTHSSGIPDHEVLLYNTIETLKEPTIYDAFDALRKQNSLLFPAGSKSLYSDAGYVLLALIIEIISGQNYAKFLGENVFKVLDFKNTTVLDETKPIIKNRAIGFRKLNDNWEKYDYDPLNYIIGDEGIYSCLADLYIWQKTWYTDILVSYNTLQQALTAGVLNDGQRGSYGFSWTIDSWNNKKVIYQTGTWVGFSNILAIIPDEKKSCIILTNSNTLTKEQRITIAKEMLFSFDLC